MNNIKPAVRVAREVRAELARQQISGLELSLALGMSRSRIQRRLAGETPFSLEELENIARLLKVPLSQFIHGLAS